MSSTQHQFLCLSHLGAGHRADVFAAICTVARSRNAALGIDGILLFDGHRFGHLLEGPTDAVRSVMRSIAADTRHERLKVLVVRALPASGALRGWTAGYCEHDALDCLEGPTLDADSAVGAFLGIVEHADLSP
jgi:hypothetical protein